MQPTIHTASESVDRKAERAVEHICQWCPTCAAKLESSRCKLICRHCGYYMSCADYY